MGRVDTLIGVGLRLARTAPTGPALLARVAGAIDPDWISRPWGDQLLAELDAAVRAVEPLPARKVERALRDAWGSKPTDELDQLDLEPAAVTPAAQVHRGVLDGDAVAVKVMRPGLAAAARRDLVLLDALKAPIGAAFPALDAEALLGEFRQRVLEEMDLEHEAMTQRRFHRALRGHPFLTIPAPVPRLTREGVLVSAWVDGVPLASTPKPDLAAARLLVFVLGAARFGTIHADPDPQDVLVLEDGRLAILDFGATSTVDAARVATAARALEAFASRRAERFAAALEELGLLPASEGPLALELAHVAFGSLAGPGPVGLDAAAVISAGQRLFGRPHELGRLLVAGALGAEDLWPARAVAQLFGVLARVGATGDWLGLARAALREGWDAAPP